MQAIVKSSSQDAPALPFNMSILAGQIAPSTAAMYERDMRAYLHYAGSSEAAFDVVMLRRWRAHLAAETTLSPNSINRMISAVKRVMKEAAAQGYIPHEAAERFGAVEGVKAAALKNRIKANARTRIEPADMRALCEKPDLTEPIGVRDAALLATLASGALRASEVVNLQYRHIQRKGGFFILMILGKNDVEPREAPLSREAAKHIEAWLTLRREILDTSAEDPESHVFTTFSGNGDVAKRLSMKPLTTTAVWQIVRKYAEQMGLHDIKPHDFRRFVGTQLARKDIRQAQKALGHKRLETTARHYVLDELEPGLTEELYATIPAHVVDDSVTPSGNK